MLRNLHRGFATSRTANNVMRMSVRSMSSSSAPAKLVEVQKDSASKTAVIRMNKLPANSLNIDFMKQLTAAIVDAEKDENIKGFVLASSSSKVFCAGLDLLELSKKDLNIEEFWNSLQELWLTLYGTKLATVAAVQGAAIAGGCLLALSCDHRIMAPSFPIGMNEAQFGLIAPTWFQATMINTVGFRKAERLLTRGELLSSDQALACGLVDEVCPAADVPAAADRELRALLAVDHQARGQTKTALRFETLERLRETRAVDAAWFAQCVRSPEVQASLSAYVASLKARSK